MIVFGQQILRGNRAKKTSITSYEAFESPNFSPLGEIGLNINLDKSRILSMQGASLLLPGFIPKVCVISIHPGLKSTPFFSIIESDIIINCEIAKLTTLKTNRPDSYYIENIMLHEIGHMIGLEDSDNKESIMYHIIDHEKPNMVIDDYTLQLLLNCY